MWRVASLCLLGAVMACGEPSSPSSPTPPSTPPAGAALSKLEVDASVLSGQTTRATVTLTAPAPPAGVAISLTASGTAATVPASLRVPAGATTASFDVVTTRVAMTTELTISAQAADVTRTASLRLRVDPTGLRPSASYTIGFSGLRDNRALVPTYTEAGFTISSGAAEWMAITTSGNPLPSLQFMAAPGVTTTGEILITSGGAPFWLNSVDFYSSTTQVPYVIEGFLSGERAYTVITVLPNTFGRFVRTENPSDNVAVDAVVIRLSNPAARCCGNPMGIDNIVLNR